MKRVIITGSRSYRDAGAIRSFLATLDPRTVIVHGGASGADTISDGLALAAGFQTEVHPADWAAHGRAAGFVRNAEMAGLGADLCAAFWDGSSRGTFNMIQAALKAGIPVLITPPSPDYAIYPTIEESLT